MTVSDASAQPQLPTAAQEARFWAMLEAAWLELGPAANQTRQALIGRAPDTEPDLTELFAPLNALLDNIIAACAELSSAELTELDRVLERKLYDIDRADVHEYTDGSDDGFLYARGFVVALGQRYYEAVRADPAVAVLDAECERMCYLFAHVHRERFGEFPETCSGISRESFNNPAGWAD